MGKNNLEKTHKKFMIGLIDIKDVPIKLIKKWNRHNFDKGEFLALKKLKIEKIQNKELQHQINNS